MIKRCKEVDVDDAEPGMVLFEAVLDAHGSVLLPEAAALTEAMLTSLRRRGIDRILVVNDAISEEALKAERERVQARLEHLFRRCGNAGACGELRRQIIEYRLGGTQ